MAACTFVLSNQIKKISMKQQLRMSKNAPDKNQSKCGSANCNWGVVPAKIVIAALPANVASKGEILCNC